MNERTLIQYLVERGEMSARELTEHGATVIDFSRRNRNLAVRREGDLRSLFVKQLKTLSPALIESFQREAEFQRLVLHDPVFAPLAPLMPNCIGYDPERACIVYEYLNDFSPVFELHTRGENPVTAVAELLGQAVGTLHGCLSSDVTARSTYRSVLPQSRPWILTILDMHVVAGEQVTEGMVQYLQLLRQFPVVRQLLHDVLQHWQTDAITHNDLSWANVLYCQSRQSLNIIDWELVDIGDAAWDLGTVLQNYWLAPVQQGLVTSNPHQPYDVWSQPLRAAGSETGAFLNAYFETRAMNPSQQHQLIQRALRCTAARAVLTGYEAHHESAHLLPTSAAILDFASSLYAHRELAAGALTTQGNPL